MTRCFQRARVALSFSPSCPTDAILLIPPSVVHLSDVLLYVCPHTAMFASSSWHTTRCPHTTTYVLILLYGVSNVRVFHQDGPLCQTLMQCAATLSAVGACVRCLDLSCGRTCRGGGGGGGAKRKKLVRRACGATWRRHWVSCCVSMRS
jgi:hypothetical protein